MKNIDKRVIIMLNAEFLYEIHKEVCSICKEDKGGKFLIIQLSTYKKYVAICESCLTKKNTGAPNEKWQSTLEETVPVTCGILKKEKKVKKE